MNIQDAIQSIREVFPNATFEEDNYGQVVIYTDKRVKDGVLAPFDYEEA